MNRPTRPHLGCRIEHLESRHLLAFLGEAGFADFSHSPHATQSEQAPFGEWLPPLDSGGISEPGPFDGFEGDGLGGPPSDSLDELKFLSTDPAPGAVLRSAIRTVSVAFDRALAPSSISFGDILLARVAEDGSLTWLDEAIESPGPGDHQVLLALDRDLAPGIYRIFLSGDSGLHGRDGARLGGVGTDRALGEFEVMGQGVGLGDAIDLGTPGPDPTSIAGDLDFGARPGDVRLYKITLPTGHFWRLGLEVTAERDGRSLDSALALFDALGRPIATSEAGREDAPKDPFLFAGLAAGTYYVGVSGTRDVPGTAIGYAPATSTPGSAFQAQAGGAFTLHLVADPADQPVSLVALGLDRADPLASTVTGISLSFSGAIRLDDPLGNPSTSIEVVDGGGRVWPVAAVDYTEALARVRYLFRVRLPEGTYTVRSPRRGGLVDLAGLSPVAPGRPPGVLGEFSIAATDDAARDPLDLGALLPDAATTGVSLEAQLQPGDSTIYRVVIAFAGTYTLQARYTGGPLSIEFTGPGGAIPADAGLPDRVNVTNDAFLAPGIYHIRLTATGSRPLVGDVTLKAPADDPERILANGVGQGPGLSLRLTGSPFPEPTPPPPPSVALPPAIPGADAESAPLRPPSVTPPPAIPGADAGSVPLPPSEPPPNPTSPGPGDTAPAAPNPTPDQGGGRPAVDPAPAASTPGSGRLFLGFGGDLLGRPAVDAFPDRIGGTGTESGGSALSLNNIGLLQGSGNSSGPSGGSLSGGTTPHDSVPAAPILEDRDEGFADDGSQFGQAMEAVLPGVEELANVISRVALHRLLTGPRDLPEANDIQVDEGDPDTSPNVEAGRDPKQARTAGISSSAAVFLAALLIGRFSPRLYRWLNRRPGRFAQRAGRVES